MSNLLKKSSSGCGGSGEPILIRDRMEGVRGGGTINFTCTGLNWQIMYTISFYHNTIWPVAGRDGNLHVVDSGLGKGSNLSVQGLDLVEVGRLDKFLKSCLLGSNQLGSDPLDASSLLSPELDIVGVCVVLNLGV